MKVLIPVVFLILCETSFTQTASIGITPSATAPCIDQPNDILLPVIGDCSQFYGCKNGNTILRNCMEGLFFDSITKNCTEPSKSDCIQEHSIAIKSEVVPTEIPEIPNYICLGKAIGSLVPSRTNCSEYYSCISSSPIVQTCGIGMHFDSYSQICISSELSNCVIKRKVEVTTTRKPELIEVVCKGKFDGEKFPVPGNCTRYFDCLEHKAYVKSCGDKHFYPVSRTCIDPEVSECFEGTVRVKTVTTESSHVNDTIIEGNKVISKVKTKIIDSDEIEDVNEDKTIVGRVLQKLNDFK
ncbi:probable chitinase 10 [Episyrphus balteatus]|uniref:probable chitinase 10 n=1 Tax=Episyrphus balteatus TaxID=286459 RepID=UPI002486BBCB|nr:probable chitinase 10 [Episyrphus balteatus]